MVRVTTFKAWAALAGSIVTALVVSPVIPVDSKVHVVLGILSAIGTAVGTYQAPYTVEGDKSESDASK